MRIDLQTLKAQTDLLALVEHDTTLKRVANTNGGEFCGPCSFCGGKDRMRVQPYHQEGGLWMCRHCTDGKWQDAIDYVMRRDSCDFKQACSSLGGAELPQAKRPRPAPQIAAYAPPAEEWQACARQVIETCHKNLFSPVGDRALDYLLGRGIAEPAMRRFMLGYNPESRKVDGCWLDRGITIPCIVAEDIWYIKVRRPVINPKEDKYRCMAGSHPAAIFNADDLMGAEFALFCEGEFDVITAWQELSPALPVVTLGSATNRLDLATWGAYLLGLKTILVTYDHDQAGDKGAAYWSELSSRVKLAPLPDGYKDINAYACAGGDLRDWIAQSRVYIRPLGTEAMPWPNRGQMASRGRLSKNGVASTKTETRREL